MKRLLPVALRNKLRNYIRDLVGTTRLYRRLEQFEERLLEVFDSSEAHRARSKIRWREAAPTTNLTWGQQLTGDEFINKAAYHNAFGPEKAVWELGPGYGRLLEAVLRLKIPFKSYVGLDISPENVRYLRDKFKAPNIEFVEGDCETTVLDGKFDLMFCSGVLKHIFPSFEKALMNVGSHIERHGKIIFDLIEGKKRFFQDDGLTYIRWYTRAEITDILNRTGFELTAFDYVQHTEEIKRLLVIATRK